ncbi:LacI family transcriptional regulator [Oenococcus sicerae]|uniref:LacI family transcriptional regulator n=1 Tax=Oenococcus sicerae TaxID=2203724 RepID=A0AAJ1R8J2_9LACO|nr:LacI family DNA-binding transcriptional regulator [Oenococcus sicerae]MDN6900119.1 LacI family transcriptional regulator [Oenococcus sicerae]QAS69727.1 LacI family transcriptional regulator [Oenococcus sicerae]
MSKKITIKEVAHKVGLSITAVSQILNGKGARFSEGNIKKVFAARDELHYVPSLAARNLSNKTDVTIGVLVPAISNPFFSEFLQSIENYSDPKTHVMMIGLDGDRGQLYSAIEGLLSQGIDGLIVAVAVDGYPEVNALLKENLIPYIVLDQNNTKDSDFIAADDFHGGQLAAQYLCSLGHEKISIVAANSEATTYNLTVRLNGFLETCRDSGIKKENIQIIKTQFTKHGGQKTAAAIIAFRPTAIFTLSDELAIGVLGGLNDYGFKVPDDFSLIGYDDTDYAEFMNPKLTTIRQPIPLLAKYALEMLKNRMINPKIKEQIRTVDVELIIRDSCKKR